MVVRMITVFIVGVMVGLSGLLPSMLWYALAIRKRHGGGMPLPAFLIRAEEPSAALRAIVAKVARSAAKDAAQEWDSIPHGLKEAIRREIRTMVATAFAVQDGRRPQ